MSEEMTTIPVSRLSFDGPKGPLFSALAEARKHYKSLSTNAKMQFGEGPKSRKHDYATLDVVIDALEPGWQKAGISVSQPHDGDSLWTIVSCGDSSMTIEQPLTGWNSAQDLGGLLTYFRRYALKGIFCVADEEDDDGSSLPGGQGKPLGRNAPAAPKATGKVSPELSAKVVEASKAAGLGGDEFRKLVYQTCDGKKWSECTDADAEKLLAELTGNP